MCALCGPLVIYVVGNYWTLILLILRMFMLPHPMQHNNMTKGHYQTDCMNFSVVARSSHENYFNLEGGGRKGMKLSNL